ncbi:hypothetical protein MSG28_011409 [Choristoneura fumiferana]|uniref:Uncharacterized protein n=1 Tax=Choristoneura fumiferana TaxID=7141 RepID=A0ACC0JNX0_CHOFU|nr:hypothetical protein MSG28_011409 [Choristoneura fumiferana]
MRVGSASVAMRVGSASVAMRVGSASVAMRVGSASVTIRVGSASVAMRVGSASVAMRVGSASVAIRVGSASVAMRVGSASVTMRVGSASVTMRVGSASVTMRVGSASVTMGVGSASGGAGGSTINSTAEAFYTSAKRQLPKQIFKQISKSQDTQGVKILFRTNLFCATFLVSPNRAGSNQAKSRAERQRRMDAYGCRSPGVEKWRGNLWPKTDELRAAMDGWMDGWKNLAVFITYHGYSPLVLMPPHGLLLLDLPLLRHLHLLVAPLDPRLRLDEGLRGLHGGRDRRCSHCHLVLWKEREKQSSTVNNQSLLNPADVLDKRGSTAYRVNAVVWAMRSIS